MVKQKHENDKRHRFFFRSYRYIRGMYVGGRIRVPSCQKPMGVRGVRGELIPKERQERKRRKKENRLNFQKQMKKVCATIMGDSEMDLDGICVFMNCDHVNALLKASPFGVGRDDDDDQRQRRLSTGEHNRAEQRLAASSG